MEMESSWRTVAQHVADLVAKQLRDNPPLVTPWLAPVQAAEYLGVTARGLETMRRNGTGPKCSRINHRVVRYHVKNLDAWLAQGGES